MNLLQLEGNVDSRDQQIEELQDEVRRLERDLLDAKAEAAQAQRDAQRSVGNLRRQLTPLYQALRAVFGEMDAIGGTESAAAPVPSRTSAVWESWKRKLGGKAAEFITVLLEHGEMNVAQLRVAAQCGQQAVYDTVAKLHKLGLINKNGGKYSLKQL